MDKDTIMNELTKVSEELSNNLKNIKYIKNEAINNVTKIITNAISMLPYKWLDLSYSETIPNVLDFTGGYVDEQFNDVIGQVSITEIEIDKYGYLICTLENGEDLILAKGVNGQQYRLNERVTLNTLIELVDAIRESIEKEKY